MIPPRLRYTRISNFYGHLPLKKLAKYLSNRWSSRATKASATLAKPSLDLAGRAASGRELFNASMRDGLLERARSEHSRLVEASKAGGQIPDSVLTIWRRISGEEWRKLEPEERGYFEAKSQDEKTQRQLIKRGETVDPFA